MRAIESDRDEITAAVRQVVADNPWYTVDQFASQVHGRYRHNMRLRYDYVLSRIGPLDGKTVIDVGCGDGQWSALLCSRFAVKLIGIDYNELRLDRYRRRLPAAEALLGTCAKIPVESGAADLVMCHQVLEHLGDPAAALIEARRVLKPNGMLLVFIPFRLVGEVWPVVNP